MAIRTTTGPDTKSDARLQSWIARTMLGLIKDEDYALCVWVIAVGVALFGYWLSEGTTYHQFAVGMMMSVATLFVLMAILEVLWRGINRQ
jgi:hypothetical protein